MLRRGRISSLLAPALIFAACTEEAHTGVVVTVKYTAALEWVLISGTFANNDVPFRAEMFTLPKPEGESGEGTIVILLPETRDGQQLKLEAKANELKLVRVVSVVIARDTLVPVTFDLRCGDGRVTTGETCDDENNSSNDGCNAECSAIEPGFVCGDGLVRPPEVCDDHNLIDGDGCAMDCTQELGWDCPTNGDNPSACFDICGDRMAFDRNRCDDGNALIGDGCDTCMIEAGWTCTTTIAGGLSFCQKCADEVIQGIESCDDGNLVDGDGCNATCTQEQGWICSGTPSMCTQCGNQTREALEGCDDGNTIPSDGCDPTCQLEQGFECTEERPNTCSPVCGDGLLRGGELCDDGNRIIDDGCDALCAKEPDWICFTDREPSVCYSEEATYFVDDTGPDCMTGDGTGTFGDPYCTLVRAMMMPRPTTVVFPGRYEGKIDVRTSMEIVAVDGATIAHGGPDALEVTEDTTIAVVRGFTIIGIPDTGGIWEGGGVKVDHATLGLYDCRIGPSGEIGVKSSGTATLRLERNFIDRNALGGVKLDGTLPHTVYNNVIVGNGDFGGVLAKEWPASSAFANNTIADNRGTASTVAGGIICERAGSVIENSIVWNNPGMAASGVDNRCTINYSLLTSAPFSGVENIYFRPQFIDAFYHIDPASPAVNAGNPDGVDPMGPAPIDDFDGDPRPINGRVDIGADEAN